MSDLYLVYAQESDYGSTSFIPLELWPDIEQAQRRVRELSTIQEKIHDLTGGTFMEYFFEALKQDPDRDMPRYSNREILPDDPGYEDYQAYCAAWDRARRLWPEVSLLIGDICYSYFMPFFGFSWVSVPVGGE